MSPAANVAGLGFRPHSGVASLRAALAAAQQAAPLTLTALATAADKAAHPAFVQLAREMALPALAITLPDLARQAATPSAHVPDRYGNHSLAEAAALAGAGPGARLASARVASPDRMATAAIATLEDLSSGVASP